MCALQILLLADDNSHYGCKIHVSVCYHVPEGRAEGSGWYPGTIPGIPQPVHEGTHQRTSIEAPHRLLLSPPSAWGVD